MLAKFLPIGLFSLLLACTAAVPASSPASPASAPPGLVSEAQPPVQPILTEEQALQVALGRAGMSAPEVTGGSELGNPQARLMTLEEYEERFESGRSYGDRSIPVWVVTVEGTWSPAGFGGRLPMTRKGQPTATPRVYTQGIEVMDARSGKTIGGQKRITPLDLNVAQGLDPESFNTYPLRVPLTRAKEFAVFPVSQPGYMPEEYSLTDIRLVLSNPVQDLLNASWVPDQTVIQEYADGQGHILLVAQSDGGMRSETIGSFRQTRVHHNAAWESETNGGPISLSWRARHTSTDPFDSPNVTHTLYSQTDSISLETLHLIAESLPQGEAPIPTPTPIVPTPVQATPEAAPAPAPTIAPVAAPISTPVTTPASSGLGSLGKVQSSSLIGRLSDGTGMTLTSDEGDLYMLEPGCTQVEAALETNAGQEVGLLLEGEHSSENETLKVLSVNNGGTAIPTCANESGGPLVPPAPPPDGQVMGRPADCPDERPVLDRAIEIVGPGELRGVICGLDPSETVTLQLRQYLDRDLYGDPVLTFAVGDGPWEHAGLGLEPGGYYLDVVTEGTDFVTFPGAYTLGAPERDIVWRYGGITFNVVSRDKVVEILGYPLCEPWPLPASPNPSPTPPPPGPPGSSGAPTCSVVGRAMQGIGGPQIGGTLTGLSSGDVVKIEVYSLSPVEGICYSAYELDPNCKPVPGPETFQQVPDLTQAELVARFSSKGPLWGLKGEGVKAGRYLVVLNAPGYEVTPTAYAVDVISYHLVPIRVGGLDFTLEPE